MPTVRGDLPGKTLAIRADCDGLPIREETGLPFASVNEGVMHACGHDCHIAMQLGAAKLLKSMEDEIEGTVKLMFQPAEETMEGGLEMVEGGGVTVEYDKLIDRQLERAAITSISGFGKICDGAAAVLNV